MARITPRGTATLPSACLASTDRTTGGGVGLGGVTGRAQGGGATGGPGGDGGAGPFELGLGLLGVLLGHLLQDRLGSAVDQVLGLLEAEVGERAHFLDDL